MQCTSYVRVLFYFGVTMKLDAICTAAALVCTSSMTLTVLNMTIDMGSGVVVVGHVMW